FSSHDQTLVLAPVKMHPTLSMNSRGECHFSKAFSEWCFSKKIFIIEEDFPGFLCVLNVFKTTTSNAIPFPYHLYVIRFYEAGRNPVSVGISNQDIFLGNFITQKHSFPLAGPHRKQRILFAIGIIL